MLAVGFLSHYLNGPLPYVQLGITVNKISFLSNTRMSETDAITAFAVGLLYELIIALINSVIFQVSTNVCT